jgi:hypothetical protein
MITARRLLGFGALVLGLAFACKGERTTGPKTGSETHFLSWCAVDGSCEDGLECLCGVCTSPCAGLSACTPLAPEAECTPLGDRPVDHSCSETKIDATCEVECTGDDDCAVLGDAHRCDRGYCRRLADDCETGTTSGSDVILIGDAFFADGAVGTELEALALATGALPAGETYRDYASASITPFGGASDLTSQYAAATGEGVARVVLMDAGGPDALLTCPDPPTETCGPLATAADSVRALHQQMATDGVQGIVQFFYPDPADAVLKAKFDVLRPMMESACAESPVPCRFLDLRPTFTGRETEYLGMSWILPTAAGAAATASAIWSQMQRYCLAQ